MGLTAHFVLIFLVRSAVRAVSVFVFLMLADLCFFFKYLFICFFVFAPRSWLCIAVCVCVCVCVRACMYVCACVRASLPLSHSLIHTHTHTHMHRPIRTHSYGGLYFYVADFRLVLGFMIGVTLAATATELWIDLNNDSYTQQVQTQLKRLMVKTIFT